ncbi:MAG: ATP-dependent DNA helicase RecG [Nitriliruptoraceae bacterium]
MTHVQLDEPVTALAGVGAAKARQLQDHFGIVTVRDLLEHYPRRYHDAGAVTDVESTVVGQPATLVGSVVDWQQKRTNTRAGRRLDLRTAIVEQPSGQRFLATFFNQPWRERGLPVGTTAAFSGKVERFRGDVQLSAPSVDVIGLATAAIDEAAFDHQRLVPLYPSTDQLPSHQLQALLSQAVERAKLTEGEWLPDELRAKHRLIDWGAAIRQIHQPHCQEEHIAARHRLVFDELFSLQLGIQWRRAQHEVDAVGRHNPPRGDGLAARFIDALPFVLTGAQQRALNELANDLAGGRPMHRLLQGDVGSGKTIVAAWSMLCAVDNRRQAAMMVPTEVLAEQHYATLQQVLAPLGVNVLDGVRIGLLTSSTPQAERRRVMSELLSGAMDVVIGTHALLQEGVRFADLGVAVVDEQHRFGVAQRVGLRQKAAGEDAADVVPDVLVMTATPIPRSLAMTIYGDLDVSVLDELPQGRQPIVTQLITPDQAHRRAALYDFVREQVENGKRAYVVCPFVEPSTQLAGRAAVEEHHRLGEILTGIPVTLVHGRMRPSEKDEAMQAFRTGQAPVLVATTVIEVGVDVPEATVMVIEDAERFGISQLHQLRGRVGRGTDKSYCVLFAGFSGELSDDARKRLEAVAATTDGFALAEADLDLRGAGQLFGARQSGARDLKLTHWRRDLRAIERTRSLARSVIAQDPQLASPQHARLRTEVLRRFDGGLEAFDILESG